MTLLEIFDVRANLEGSDEFQSLLFLSLLEKCGPDLLLYFGICELMFRLLLFDSYDVPTQIRFKWRRNLARFLCKDYSLQLRLQLTAMY